MFPCWDKKIFTQKIEHNMNDYFIAIYTNQVKDYCDENFFNNVFLLSKGNPVHVVDNTIGNQYYEKLKKMFSTFENFHLYKTDIDEQPKKTQFHRNVSESVNLLRDIFLKTGYKKFLIIESDVLPPENLIQRLESSINLLNDKWGILGAHYYSGFHDYNKKYIYNIYHALSGCTVYNRKLIEKYSFRWSEENMAAFPDAWICYDAGKEYEIYNDGSIICRHLFYKTGGKYSKKL